MWLHFTINTVKTLVVFPTSRKYGNLHAVTHLFNYFENCNIHIKKVLNIKKCVQFPHRMFVGNSLNSDKYFESYTQDWHRNTYLFSWKMVVKIVNHKTRMHGCRTGCEQVHGIHTSCQSSNNEVGVMSSNKSEYLKLGRLKTHTHQNWISVYAGRENVKWSQKCLKVHFTSHKNEWM
jgi:hypothetical protein